MRGFFLVCCALLAWCAYAAWPEGITDRALASITLGQLLRVLGAGLLGVWALMALIGALNDDS